MKKIIVISAHADDEIIGAGGTLLRHKEAADELYWLIVTNIFESQGFSLARVSSRQHEISQVANELGIKKIFKLDHPTMTLSGETLIRLVPQVAEIFQEVKPEIVYCLNRSDAHSDHRVVFDAVVACTKSFRHPYIKGVFMYECISETEFAPALPERVFIPNYFVDITKFMDAKLKMLNIYVSEMGEHPFPRSADNVRALAHFRGATAGVKYAEAFQLIKWIEK
ncbi:MAG: PIG-L family deacetylase [Cyclobacteriaceae bacterium]|jgi:LmbE family N-acetylglucosaminyl deacetylase|nr:PIG-L family deacetylase [Cytophagales bacterium]MCZ8327592.1 PIG-L family deacetylase [Cyclobacteriaceae bacterium]